MIFPIEKQDLNLQKNMALMNTQSIAEARALLDEFEAQMDEDVKIEL
ncbi:hypothetical protein [Staphylococcus aureus]|nr:hypothetical protein HMPREF0782_2000 [Staphylococcus aureus subsp. aureus ATCC 51811]EFK82794.1 hypothetical protein HMPREF0773_11077 [Staphylococcus aureus subsp. aureus TCH70]KOQ00999.1 tRNA-dihydrouridine synthase [Staphylococcus aureus]QBP94998.1 tRNA-dihydrouridine synthase [Staphylococcus aureus]SCU30500.1 tRNA dihydrouridine synthase B [Staphylococcus aureus]